MSFNFISMKRKPKEKESARRLLFEMMGELGHNEK
jgi:hypothetical protein